MTNQELSAMIADEVKKAVAPLYAQLEQIKSPRAEIEEKKPCHLKKDISGLIMKKQVESKNIKHYEELHFKIFL